MAKKPKKSVPILTHAVVAGKKFLLAKDWNETKNVMALIDDTVEIVEPKLRTGVVDIPAEVFTAFAWSRHQMEKALAALADSGKKVVTLEFLPKEDAAPKKAKTKKAAPAAAPEPAPAVVPEMAVHGAG